MITTIGGLIGVAAICLAILAFVIAQAGEGLPAAVIGLLLFVFGVVATAGAFYWGPQYDVWQQGMAGQAELKRAEQNRQIRIEEARAGFEAAKLNANAEVERAKGAAEANRIMAESLGGPDRYLRWRWIVMLETNEKHGIAREIIYVPADGNLPMTEAGRAVIQTDAKGK